MKDIVVFGTGKYFENYMLLYGKDERKRPIFAVDNDSSKAGTVCHGVEVRSAEALKQLPKEGFYVIICCADHQAVGKQLEDMGIADYHYYRPVPVEKSVCYTMRDGEFVLVPEDAELYEVGYVPGVFDLFHVGHLNLFRNAKSRCKYLIVGVLTDELVEHFKHRKPVIPYAQRAAIVAEISYVDRVVPVDFSNTYKIDAWHRYHYDCHFSGNDHGADWSRDLKQLREVGSNMEFFEYTTATSSSHIRGLTDSK